MTSNYVKNMPDKSSNQTLLDYNETLTNWYVNGITPEYQRSKGQYFTPKELSKFMVNQFENLHEFKKISILDPGAGIGIFESTFCEQILNANKKVRISFDIYENDSNVIPILEKNMEVCEEIMSNNGFKIDYNIFSDDFILSNLSPFKDEKIDFCISAEKYDLVISNPPYYKLRNTSPHVVNTKNIMPSHPNIYPLFMTVASKLLKKGGQMVFLTPRSYCSGLYFKNFRNTFFTNIKPKKIHIFNSRQAIFKKYNVLQENIILTSIKSSKKTEYITISSSHGIPHENETLKIRTTDYDKVIVERNDDTIMRIPTSYSDELISECIDKFDNKLDCFNLKVSTGKVVPFRAKELLVNDINSSDNFVPLIWMHNILDGVIKWPAEKRNRAVGVKITEKSNKILVPNKNYVLIKRFSTKEGKERITVGVHLKNKFGCTLFGIENHINYIYKLEGELTINEVYGIAALINSKLYNQYFQITNGNTQVNAYEINELPLPPMETIKEIGRLTKKIKANDSLKKEKIILNLLGIDVTLCDALF